MCASYVRDFSAFDVCHCAKVSPSDRCVSTDILIFSTEIGIDRSQTQAKEFVCFCSEFFLLTDIIKSLNNICNNIVNGSDQAQGLY
jgi:hypothetical protein